MLQRLLLQNFRSYEQADFTLNKETTVIIGPNTAGKTNLVEALYLLSAGKSFKGVTDGSLIRFGKEIGRIKALMQIPSSKSQDTKEEKMTLEVVLMSPQYNSGRFGKKFLVNDVPKSRNNFIGFLPLVLFRPEELDIIIDGPTLRRGFLNNVLEQVDREYLSSLNFYERALRQRNALLDRAREGHRDEKQFSYWDDLVIEHGQVITKKREELINWINEQDKDLIDFKIIYDHSKISRERLDQYKDAEVAAGVTLVGPHRDDFLIEISQRDKKFHDVRIFGSRGQQRLVVLQLKFLQIKFMEEKLGEKPLLVLDDIFSELDSGHIQLVLDKISGQQTVITTTHKEFIPGSKLKGYDIIDLLNNE